MKEHDCEFENCSECKQLLKKILISVDRETANKIIKIIKNERIILAMPTIKEIDNAKIKMNYEDHMPPHVHVEDGDNEVVYEIKTLKQRAPKDISDIKLINKTKLKKIKTWIKEEKSRLLKAWEKASNGLSVSKKDFE